MSVGRDFQRFRSSYNIDQQMMSWISYRYQRITRQLNYDFWGIDSSTRNSLYVGSYGRDTAASGVSDLDIGFILHWDIYWRHDAYVLISAEK